MPPQRAVSASAIIARLGVTPERVREVLIAECEARVYGPLDTIMTYELSQLSRGASGECPYVTVCGEWIFDEVWDFVMDVWRRQPARRDAAWQYLALSVLARDLIWRLGELDCFTGIPAWICEQVGASHDERARATSEMQCWLVWVLDSAGRTDHGLIASLLKSPT